MPWSKSQTVSLAFSRAYNRALATGKQEAMLPSLKKDLEAIESIVLPVVKTAKAARKDKYLSPAGKRAKIQEIRENASKQLKSSDKTATLAQGVENLKAIVQGKIKAERDAQREATPASELRLQTLLKLTKELDDKAEAEHKAKMEQWQKEGRAIPDQMREFVPPSKLYYLDGCRNYDGSQEQFLSAMDALPWPFTMLGDATIKQGQELLAQAICPEDVEMAQEGELRLYGYQQLMQAAQEITQAPDKEALFEEPKKALTPDNQAQLDELAEREAE